MKSNTLPRKGERLDQAESGKYDKAKKEFVEAEEDAYDKAKRAKEKYFALSEKNGESHPDTARAAHNAEYLRGVADQARQQLQAVRSKPGGEGLKAAARMASDDVENAASDYTSSKIYRSGQEKKFGKDSREAKEAAAVEEDDRKTLEKAKAKLTKSTEPYKAPLHKPKNLGAPAVLLRGKKGGMYYLSKGGSKVYSGKE